MNSWVNAFIGLGIGYGVLIFISDWLLDRDNQ